MKTLVQILCKDCAWWIGRCGDEPEFKVCHHPKVGSSESNGFGSFDGEPYNGGAFASGPDFGCIHGEPR